MGSGNKCHNFLCHFAASIAVNAVVNNNNCLEKALTVAVSHQHGNSELNFSNGNQLLSKQSTLLNVDYKETFVTGNNC